MKKKFHCLLDESFKNRKKKSLNLFENGEMTFGEIREIVESLFKEEICKVRKQKPYCTVALTCRNGNAMGILDTDDPSKPINLKSLVSALRCDKPMKEAMVNSLKMVEEKLSDLKPDLQNELFENGHRFINFEIMPVKSEEWLSLHGNKLPIFFLGSKRFADDFSSELPLSEDGDEIFNKNVVSLFVNEPTTNLLSEDDEDNDDEDEKVMKKRMKKCRCDDPLCHCEYAFDPKKIDKFNNSCCQRHYNDLMGDLNQLVDGLGYRATLNDYVKDRYERKIINAAMQSNVDMRRSSDFVSELVDRFSSMTNKRPTMADLNTYAKREGIDIKSENYRKFLDILDQEVDNDNAEMLKPIVKFLIKILVAYFNSMRGYASLQNEDLCESLEKTCETLQSIETLDDSTIKNVKDLFNNLKEFEESHCETSEYPFIFNDKPYCLLCKCPNTDLIREKIFC